MQETNQNTTEKNINSNNQPQKTGRKLWPVIISSTGLIVVILLIGVGAALAGRVWDPAWNPFHSKNSRDNHSFVLNISQSFSDIVKIFYKK